MACPAPRINQSNIILPKLPFPYLHLIPIPPPAISKLRGELALFLDFFFTLKIFLVILPFQIYFFLKEKTFSPGL